MYVCMVSVMTTFLYTLWLMYAPNNLDWGVHIQTISNSCIMYLSDLPDMYTQARGPLGPRAWVQRPSSLGVHIRQITRARDTTDMYHVG